MTAGAARAPLNRPTRIPGKPGTSRPSRPTLRLVQRRSAPAPRAPFVAVLVLMLGTGLLGLLALNTMINQDAFALHTLQKQSAELAAREQVLQKQVDAREVPAALAARATALGMVQDEPFGLFIDLRTGRVLGNTEGETATIPVVPVKPVAPVVPVVKAPTTTKTTTATTTTKTPTKTPTTKTITKTTTTKTTKTPTTKAPTQPGTTTGTGR